MDLATRQTAGMEVTLAHQVSGRRLGQGAQGALQVRGRRPGGAQVREPLNLNPLNCPEPLNLNPLNPLNPPNP